MLIQPHPRRGFSLVELMIGIAIFAILLAAGAPGFSTFMQNTRVRNAAESLQNGLTLARTEALRRNANVQFVLTSDPGWTVGCATVSATCPAAIQAWSSAEGATKVAIASSEVVASTGSAPGTSVFTTALSFNGLGRITSDTLAAGDNALFDISNPTAGTCAASSGKIRCLRVIATSSGQVRMCDPALTITNPTNPQAC